MLQKRTCPLFFLIETLTYVTDEHGVQLYNVVQMGKTVIWQTSWLKLPCDQQYIKWQSSQCLAIIVHVCTRCEREVWGKCVNTNQPKLVTKRKEYLCCQTFMNQWSSTSEWLNVSHHKSHEKIERQRCTGSSQIRLISPFISLSIPPIFILARISWC